MPSNYPPGVTGLPHSHGVYKATCPNHGPIYLRGYQELGGLFLEANPASCCEALEDAAWYEVHATRCPQCSQWTDTIVPGLTEMLDFRGQPTDDDEQWVYTRFHWQCPDNHTYQTEET